MIEMARGISGFVRAITSALRMRMGVIGLALFVALVGCALAGRPAPHLVNAGLETAGLPSYPSAGLRVRAGLIEGLGATQFLTCIADTRRGYQYFSMNSFPSNRIAKVRVNDAMSSPTVVSMTWMEKTGDVIQNIAIDEAAGYLYVGINASSGSRHCRIDKFRLGTGDEPLRKTGELVIPNEYPGCYSIVLDPAAGIGLTDGGHRVYKFALGAGDAASTLLSSLDLGRAYNCYASIYDSARRIAYVVSSSTNPARVFKIALNAGSTPPSLIGSTQFSSSEQYTFAGCIDPAGEYGYLGVSYRASAFPVVVKVRLGDGDTSPTRVGSLPISTSEFRAMHFLPSLNQIIVPSTMGRGQILQIAPGPATGSPTLVASTDIPFANFASFPALSSIDTSRSLLMVVGRGPLGLGPGKVSLPDGSTPPQFGGGCGFQAIGPVAALAVDQERARLYAVAGSAPSSLRQYTIEDAEADPSVQWDVLLESADEPIGTMLLDAERGYIYLVTQSAPARVVKLKTGSQSTPPVRLGAVTLDVGENTPTSAQMDPIAECAYVICESGKVVKVALGDGDALPRRMGVMQITQAAHAVLDPQRGYGYFTGDLSTSQIHRALLRPGDVMPTLVNFFSVNAIGQYGPGLLQGDVLSFMYSGTNNTQWSCVKYDISDPDAKPRRLASLPGISGGKPLALTHDAEHGLAYVSTDATPGRIWKITGLAGEASAINAGSILLDSGIGPAATLAFDRTRGFCYAGTRHHLSNLVKLATSRRGAMWGSRFELHQGGYLRSASFYSHAAAGSVRLGLFREDGATTRTLVWQSESTGNTIAAEFLKVSVDQGQPRELWLKPGGYVLAWQVDTLADVASYNAGSAGDGMMLNMPYADFPTRLRSTDRTTSWTTTAERYTGYITFDTSTAVGQEAWALYDSSEANP